MSKSSNEDAENGGLTGKERQSELRHMKMRHQALFEATMAKSRQIKTKLMPENQNCDSMCEFGLLKNLAVFVKVCHK